MSGSWDEFKPYRLVKGLACVQSAFPSRDFSPGFQSMIPVRVSGPGLPRRDGGRCQAIGINAQSQGVLKSLPSYACVIPTPCKVYSWPIIELLVACIMHILFVGIVWSGFRGCFYAKMVKTNFTTQIFGCAMSAGLPTKEDARRGLFQIFCVGRGDSFT